MIQDRIDLALVRAFRCAHIVDQAFAFQPRDLGLRTSREVSSDNLHAGLLELIKVVARIGRSVDNSNAVIASGSEALWQHKSGKEGQAHRRETHAFGSRAPHW